MSGASGPVRLVAEVEALLPQTQCARCGHPGCGPYAAALVAGEADLNLCEPGGDALIGQLADLLERPVLPPAHPVPPARVLAWIREDDCIGCARCLPACPVDAIVGARRLAHTVLAEDCTGCGLCLPPCPTDCIELRPAPIDWDYPAPDVNLARFRAHQARLATRTVAHDDARTGAQRRAELIAAARSAAAMRRGVR